MALYKRGRFWWVSISRGGRRICKSTKLEDKRRAKAVEQALLLSGSAENGAGKRIEIGASERPRVSKEFILGLLSAVYGELEEEASIDHLWCEYLEVMKVKGKVIETKSMRDKKSCLDRFLGWAKERGIRSIVQVDGNAAQGYALGLVGQCSSKRRRNILAHLSSVWNAALPNHRGAVNPWSVVIPVVKPENERVGFTREEEARVLKAAKEVHEQWFVASMIARHTGLRYGDVCRMEWGQVDFGKGVICVRPHKTAGSSGVVVVVPMADVLKTVLTEWKQTWEPDRNTAGEGRSADGRFSRGAGAVVPSETERTNRRRVGVLPTDRVLPWLREYGPKDERRFSLVLRKAGLDPAKYSFHSWRHTICSRMGEVGVDTETRKRIVGHTTNEMARHYDHSQHLDEMKAALEEAAI